MMIRLIAVYSNAPDLERFRSVSKTDLEALQAEISAAEESANQTEWSRDSWEYDRETCGRAIELANQGCSIYVARDEDGYYFAAEMNTIAAVQAALCSTDESESLMRAISEENGWLLAEESGLLRIIPQPLLWHADDGNAEVVEQHDSAQEAAQSYVDGGDWEIDSTIWVSVRVWREALDGTGEIVEVDEAWRKIAVDPEEPECVEGEVHDWQTPYEIVGGCRENPGVWGSGGSVAITWCCMHCGCAKTVDHWAQDPEDGQQGLRSVCYEVGRYADEVRGYRLAKLPAIEEDEGEFSTDRLVYDEREAEYYVLHLNGGERGAHQQSGNFFPSFLAPAERLSPGAAKQWLVDGLRYSAEDAEAALAAAVQEIK